jgi:7-cyano-7-deazaguanine synthase in queuosine biosynthesis
VKEVVLLNSGGLDGAILAHKLKEDGFGIHSLYFDMGQPNHPRCSVAAEETARRYCLDHKVIKIDFGGSPADNPFGDTHSIPSSSAVLFSLGLVYAKMIGCLEVYSGHKDNITPQMVEMFNKFGYMNKLQRIRGYIVVPMCELWTYHDLRIWAGVDLNDFAYTHSCGHAKPCGECNKCIERAELITATD